MGLGFSPFCVTWEDRFDDEQGYRIDLAFSGTREAFEFVVPANVTYVVFPPAAQIDRSDQKRCIARSAGQIGVSALRSGTWERFDVTSFQLECGQR